MVRACSGSPARPSFNIKNRPRSRVLVQELLRELLRTVSRARQSRRVARIENVPQHAVMKPQKTTGHVEHRCQAIPAPQGTDARDKNRGTTMKSMGSDGRPPRSLTHSEATAWAVFNPNRYEACFLTLRASLSRSRCCCCSLLLVLEAAAGGTRRARSCFFSSPLSCHAKHEQASERTPPKSTTRIDGGE